MPLRGRNRFFARSPRGQTGAWKLVSGQGKDEVWKKEGQRAKDDGENFEAPQGARDGSQFIESPSILLGGGCHSRGTFLRPEEIVRATPANRR